jgi:hypothetical protein
MLLIGLLVLLVLIVFQDDQREGLIRYVESGLSLPLTLGIACGILLHRFLGMAHTWTRVSNRRLLIVAAPLVIFGALGLFQPEIHRLTSRFQGIQTPYLSLTLGAVETANPEQIENALDNSDPGTNVFAIETNFRLGIRQINTIADLIARDIYTLQQLCSNQSPLIARNLCPTNPRDINEQLTMIKDYFDLIGRILDCLEWYGERYANGLPIQEDLSRIAAGYAVLGSSADPNNGGTEDSNDGSSRALFSIVTELQRAHEAFGSTEADLEKKKHACQTLADPGLRTNASGRICPDLDLQKFDGKYELDDFSKCVIEQRSKLLPRGSSKIPYRALFEAYVMVASDYPTEGALHALRYYDEMKGLGDATSLANPIENIGAIYAWLFEIRLLSELDSLLLKVKDYRTHHIVLLRLRESLHDYLEAIGGPDTQAAPEELRECVVYPDAKTGTGHVLQRRRFRDTYVLNLWMVAINTDARMLYYKAKNLSEFVSTEDERLASELNQIALNPAYFNSCFSADADENISGTSTGEIFSEKDLDEVRANLMLSYAYTLVSLVRNQRNGPFEAESTKLLEKARSTLRQARDLLDAQNLVIQFPEDEALTKIALEDQSNYLIRREIEREYDKVDEALRNAP